MFTDALKSRLTFLVALIPVLGAIHVAGINFAVHQDAVSFLTISDYFSLSFRRFHLLFSILFFSCVLYATNCAMLNAIAPKIKVGSNRSTAIGVIIVGLPMIVLLVTIIILSDSPSRLSFSNEEAERPGLKYAFVSTYLGAISLVFAAIALYRTADGCSRTVLYFADQKLDLFLFVTLAPIVLLDYPLDRNRVSSNFKASFSSCMGEGWQSVNSMIAIERGLLVSYNGQVHLISYDCLKDATLSTRKK